jgi:hypothetical protein
MANIQQTNKNANEDVWNRSKKPPYTVGGNVS